jgi:hypothetical protein
MQILPIRTLIYLASIALLRGSEHQPPSSVALSEPGAPGFKYEVPRFLTGSIYSRDAKELLFKFKRTANRSRSTLNVEREFTYPDGKPAAREQVVYDPEGLVLYELQDLQLGATGSVSLRRAPGRPTGATLEFRYTAGPGAKPKTRRETWQENTLIADMVGPFLAQHLPHCRVVTK